MNEYQRIHDVFAHVAAAIALRFAFMTLTGIYQTPMGLQLPLPPYPGNYIHVPQVVRS